MTEQARGNWTNTIGWLVLLLGWFGLLFVADLPEAVEIKSDVRVTLYRYLPGVQLLWVSWLIVWWLWSGRQIVHAIRQRFAPGVLGGILAVLFGAAILPGLADTFTQQVALSPEAVIISTTRTRTAGDVRFRPGAMVSFYRAPLPHALLSGNLRQRFYLEQVDLPPIVVTLAPPGRAALIALLQEKKVPEIFTPPK